MSTEIAPAPADDVLVRLHTWEHVTLAAPSSQTVLGGELVVVFDDGPEDAPDIWIADALFRNHIRRLRATTFNLAKHKKEGFHGISHSDDLRRWVGQTRELVAGVVLLHGAAAARAMMAAVLAVQEQRMWTACFKPAPRSPQRVLELRWAAETWAFDQVLQVFKAHAPTPSRDQWVHDVLQHVVDDTETRGYPQIDDITDTAKTAIKRLKKRLIPEHKDRLVAQILSDARTGPYGPDGTRLDGGV